MTKLQKFLKDEGLSEKSDFIKRLLKITTDEELICKFLEVFFSTCRYCHETDISNRNRCYCMADD